MYSSRNSGLVYIKSIGNYDLKRITSKFRDRTNPLEIYDDLELIERFRFDRRTILQITQLLQNDLESSTFRSKGIPPLIKVLISVSLHLTLLVH
jgi:hypothetical protein